MDVAVDTSVFASDWWLSGQMRELLLYLRETRCKLLLHEVVEIELEARFLSAWDDLLDRGGRLAGPRRPDLESFRAETVTEWRANLAHVLTSDIVQRLPLNRDHLRPVVERLAQRIPPSSKGGEQFRDVVLWLGLLEHADAHRHRLPLVLICRDSGFKGNELEMEGRDSEIRILTSLGSFLSEEHKRKQLTGELQVTGGSLTVTGLGGGPHFTLEGDGFTFSNQGAEPGSDPAAMSPYPAGARISLDSTFAGEFGLGSGPVMFHGESFPRLYYTGVINFHETCLLHIRN